LPLAKIPMPLPATETPKNMYTTWNRPAMVNLPPVKLQSFTLADLL